MRSRSFAAVHYTACHSLTFDTCIPFHHRFHGLAYVALK